MIRLDELSPEAFLERYWQRRPLLVRGALPGFVPPIVAEDLAALACTELVESRLVVRSGGGHLELRHGPFDEETFAALPERGWTLLVQAVDRVVPEVAALVEEFRFLPNWRFDDVMVSYAADGGGVGAHVDRYDVFLLQGSGRRRWEIEQEPGAPRRSQSPGPLATLSDFRCETEWTLEPGDLLYLPPGVAHRGTAVGPCTTFSIGFRAPSRDELCAALLAELLREADPDARYEDPGVATADRPGEIDPEALGRVRGLIERGLFDEPRFASWFGRFVTMARRGEDDFVPQRVWTARSLRAALLDSEATLRRCATGCFAYSRGDGSGRPTVLFVCGESFELEGELAGVAGVLCDGAVVGARELGGRVEDAGWMELLVGLVNRGYLLVDGV
jgi:50S ribosomal protein L16 3-hydroxylase